ncbi:MAG: hypothetical protein C4297_07605 [Gemmataceae bacterium]
MKKLDWQREPISHRPISIVLLGDGATAAAPELMNALREVWATHEGVQVILAGVVLGEGLQSGAHPPPDRAAWEYVTLPAGEGYGPTLAAALDMARHPQLLTILGDVCPSAEDLHLVRQAVDDVDIVCGVSPAGGWVRTGLRKVRQLVWGACMGVHVSDPWCPIRLYRRHILERIVIQSRGRFADVEVIAKANFLDALIGEVVLSRTYATRLAREHVLGDMWRVFRRPAFRSVAQQAVEASPSAARS